MKCCFTIRTPNTWRKGGHISYGSIVLYRATTFCRQNRILHPIMDPQLVWGKKPCLFSEVSSVFWSHRSPWIFLGQVSSWKRSIMGGGGWNPGSTGPDEAQSVLCCRDEGRWGVPGWGWWGGGAEVVGHESTGPGVALNVPCCHSISAPRKGIHFYLWA